MAKPTTVTINDHPGFANLTGRQTRLRVVQRIERATVRHIGRLHLDSCAVEDIKWQRRYIDAFKAAKVDAVVPGFSYCLMKRIDATPAAEVVFCNASTKLISRNSIRAAMMVSSAGDKVNELISAPFLWQMEQLQRKPLSIAQATN